MVSSLGRAGMARGMCGPAEQGHGGYWSSQTWGAWQCASCGTQHWNPQCTVCRGCSRSRFAAIPQVSRQRTVPEPWIKIPEA
eukprot:14707765-Alexandrium_andersonii.AAC.1